MKRIAVLLVSLGLILSACSSPTPATTEAPAPTAAVEQSTATLAPTDGPAPTEMLPTNTPEPTATLKPQPQVISEDNAASLTFQGLIELPANPNLVAPYVLFTSDSKQVLVQTEAGLDALNIASLEVEDSYPGVQARDLLADGRVYGKLGDQVVFLDLASGQIEPIEGIPPFSGRYVVSPQGNKLAYVQDDKTIQVVDLASGQATAISIKFSTQLNKLVLNSDGSILIAWWELGYPNASYIAYDTVTGNKLYEQPTNRMPPQLLEDGEHVAVEPIGNAVEIHTIADNKAGDTVSVITDLTERFFGGRFFVAQNGKAIIGLYGANSGSAAIVVSEIPTNRSLAVVTRSDPGGPKPELFLAPDASSFIVVWPEGRLELHKSDGGEVIAETDRYSVGSHLALSPNGQLIAWTDFEGVNVYNWQTSEFVLQQKHSTVPVGVGRVGFIGDNGLFVSLNTSFVNKFGFNEQLPQLSLWDLGSGQITNAYDSLSGCDVQDTGTYIKCSVYKVTSDYIGIIATRIFPISDPNTVVATDNEAKVFMVSSPTADGYASCEVGGSTISVKAGSAPAVRLNYPCQPFF